MIKHGMSHSPEYRSWTQMKNRCSNHRCKFYPIYGGRGIEVCARWGDFQGFFQDMGQRPTIRHSLDRIDPNGNYEPGNCRWATSKEQQRNRRNNRVYTYLGRSAPLSELCELHGMNRHTVMSRLNYGASIEVAMSKGRIPRGTIKPDLQRKDLKQLKEANE